MNMTRYRLAIDVGGTFIDFLLFDAHTGTLRMEKVLTTTRRDQAFFDGLDRLGVPLAEVASITHGSTIVLNAILQENGARVGLITTQGFRDVLELGRGNRAEIYNFMYKPPTPLVPRYLRHEVPERITHRGGVLRPLDEVAAQRVLLQLKSQGVDSVAICFLHAYANDVHERRMVDLCREHFPQAFVSCSSEIVREWREFERTSTTVLNAYTQPRLAAYLSALTQGLQQRGYGGTFCVMQSSGGVLTSAVAQRVPIRTIQSGPAGGVIGTIALGAQLGLPNLIAADVGGTSFDVALILNGQPAQRHEVKINRRPVLQPTLDIVSIGAGGGSIAWLDEGGGLRVGPHSAESDPGPVCFAKGGQRATVTDAQLVLGWLDAERYLGGRMRLDVSAAAHAIEIQIAQPLRLTLIEAARGIVQLANANMANAIRHVTVERGHDPRDFSLVCFGGGGGLFAGSLLTELEHARAIVPLYPAAFSAWGLLNADYREDVTYTGVHALANLSPAQLGNFFEPLIVDVMDRLRQMGVSDDNILIERFAELRYAGQEHPLRVPVLAADLTGFDLAQLRQRFDDAHEQAHAHALPQAAVELVHIHVSGLGKTPKPVLPELAVGLDKNNQRVERSVCFDGHTVVACPVYQRESLGTGATLHGPAIVEEWSSTVLVWPGQTLQVDSFGNLLIHA